MRQEPTKEVIRILQSIAQAAVLLQSKGVTLEAHYKEGHQEVDSLILDLKMIDDQLWDYVNQN